MIASDSNHRRIGFGLSGESIKLILSRLVLDKNQGEISEHKKVHHIAIILLRASPNVGVSE